jgi:hypothetical protein
MTKAIIIIIIILIIIWAVFVRGSQPAEAPMDDNDTASLPTVELDNEPAQEASSDKSSDSNITTNNDSVLLNPQTFTNKFEPYTLNFHEYWAWRRYNDVGDNNIISIVAFDPESLEDRPYTDAAIFIMAKSVDDIDILSGDPSRRREHNDRFYLLGYNIETNEYLDIFNAMVASFRFLD